MIDVDDYDRVHEFLLGVELVSAFAMVGLCSFGLGWQQSTYATFQSGVEAGLVGAAPFPAWVEPGLWAAAIVMVVTAVAEVYVLMQERDASLEELVSGT